MARGSIDGGWRQRQQGRLGLRIALQIGFVE
jgi:hypothetical protein